MSDLSPIRSFFDNVQNADDLVTLQQTLVGRHIKDVIDDCDQFISEGDYKSIILIRQQTLDWLSLAQMTIQIWLMRSGQEIKMKKNAESYKLFNAKVCDMFKEKIDCAVSRKCSTAISD